MKVLVTGATGAVGRRIVARLVARGDSVLALSRSRIGRIVVHFWPVESARESL